MRKRREKEIVCVQKEKVREQHHAKSKEKNRKKERGRKKT